MRILAIDPGPTASGLVLLDAECWPPVVLHHDREAGIAEAKRRVGALEAGDTVVCEWLTSYGTAVGRDVLDTARVVGRFEQMASGYNRGFALLTRPDVALELCQSRRAKDAQIAEAIREIYREAGLAVGGGSDPVRGTKKQPGPLFGLALGDHEGSALAVGLAWLRRVKTDVE